MNVYYTYDFVERTKIWKGFDCKKITVNKFVGKYDTLEEAKKHPNIEEEKQFPKGYYIFTDKELEEKVPRD